MLRYWTELPNNPLPWSFPIATFPARGAWCWCGAKGLRRQGPSVRHLGVGQAPAEGHAHRAAHPLANQASP
jgi:hypothetical protein